MHNLPSSSWLDELRQGLALTQDADHDGALACFERAYAQAPDRSETACALGREHMRRGESARACELLDKAWQTDPTLFSAGTSLARCLGLHLHQWQQAHAVLTDVDHEHGVTEDTRLIRGELLLAEGRHEEAGVLASGLAESTQRAIAEGAVLLISRVENSRGLHAAQQNCFERAIFAFKRAGDLDTSWAAPHSNMGAAFQELGKFQRAQQAYRDALLLDPHYARAWHNLALLYRRLGDNRAMDSFERAFYSAPAQVEMAVDYALALLRREAPELADDALLAHASERGDCADTWIDLASPLISRGAARLATTCLARARERALDPAQRKRIEGLLESCSRAGREPAGEL